MDTAGRLELILIFVLQLEGLSERVRLYKRPGQDAALPCGSAPPNEPTCSAVDWLYSRDRGRVLREVIFGNVRESSARAARLSVDAACSLVINTVTAEDAGFYTCRPFMDVSQDASTYLSVMTISSSPPDDEVTLTCSLVTHIDLQPCRRNSIRWVDETGRLLLGDGDGYTFMGQTDCDSVLTVRRQSDPNRRYTCQFIDSERTVAIQADYTPVFKGLSERVRLYKRPGQDAALPCGSAPPNEPTCSAVSWLYSRDGRTVLLEVKSGNVRESSARAARLSVDAACSLVINNVTVEDAGLYTCRPSRDASQDANTYLSVMTISSSPPDDKVTLTCSLMTHIDLQPCRRNSIRWVDETGRLLLGDGDGYTFMGQTDCDSVLTVRRQSDPNRRYTCQFIDSKNAVAIQADYTPVFKDRLPPIGIISGAAVGALVVLVVVAVVFIKYRKTAKVTEDVQKPSQHPDEPDIHLTYVTVSHANYLPSPNRKVKEEEVTYSTVSTSVKTEINNDPSGFYSTVSKPE